jgi:hypothetical protein
MTYAGFGGLRFADGVLVSQFNAVVSLPVVMEQLATNLPSAVKKRI